MLVVYILIVLAYGTESWRLRLKSRRNERFVATYLSLYCTSALLTVSANPCLVIGMLPLNKNNLVRFLEISTEKTVLLKIVRFSAPPCRLENITKIIQKTPIYNVVRSILIFRTMLLFTEYFIVYNSFTL